MSAAKFWRRGRRRAGPRHIARDLIHDDTVRRLKMFPGVTVWDLGDVGGGFPDLIVGYQGRNTLVELKAVDGQLTENEREWHLRWRGQVAIVVGADGHEACLKVLDLIGFPDWEPKEAA